MKYKIEIRKKLYSKDFRWIEINVWKKLPDFYAMKIHTKFALTLHTLKIFIKGFPGSVYVNWRKV